MEHIKKIGILSLAKFQTVIGGLIGVICGVLYSFGGLAIDVLVTLQILDPVTWGTPGLSYGTLLAFGALIGMPLIFAGFGFLLGIFEGLLYNLYARWFGGIKVDLG